MNEHSSKNSLVEISYLHYKMFLSKVTSRPNFFKLKKYFEIKTKMTENLKILGKIAILEHKRHFKIIQKV